ncbi:MAG: right-handed parallel beta-helix repeat-containing protein [Planctomycetota bacterium]
MKTLVYAISALVLLASSARATDYYVATNGNDFWPGTKALPFKTPYKAVQTATQPGDTIFLRGGVYAPPPWGLGLGASGLPGQLITLRSYPGETAVIDGANLDPGTNAINIAASYRRVEGLEVCNSAFTGISLYGPGSFVHDIEIVGNTVHDCWNSAIYAGTNTVSDPIRDILIEGNVGYRCVLMNEGHPLGGGWGYGMGAGVARNVVVRGNTIFENQGEGLGFYLSEDCTAEGNTLYDNFSVQLYLDNASSCRLVGNVATTTGNPDFFRFGEPAVCVQIANEDYGVYLPSADNVIANNVLIGGRHAFYYGSYQMGGGLRTTRFVNNTAHGSTSALLKIDADAGHADSLFANNVLDQTRTAALTLLLGSMAEIDFHHNLWHGGQPAPAAAGVGDLLAAPHYRDAAQEDLHLVASSPGIDAGQNAVALEAGLVHDHDGRRRALEVPSAADCTAAPGTCGPAPVVDLGAFELPAGDQAPSGLVPLPGTGG